MALALLGEINQNQIIPSCPPLHHPLSEAKVFVMLPAWTVMNCIRVAASLQRLHRKHVSFGYISIHMIKSFPLMLPLRRKKTLLKKIATRQPHLCWVFGPDWGQAVQETWASFFASDVLDDNFFSFLPDFRFQLEMDRLRTTCWHLLRACRKLSRAFFVVLACH